MNLRLISAKRTARFFSEMLLVAASLFFAAVLKTVTRYICYMNSLVCLAVEYMDQYLLRKNRLNHFFLAIFEAMPAIRFLPAAGTTALAIAGCLKGRQTMF